MTREDLYTRINQYGLEKLLPEFEAVQQDCIDLELVDQEKGLTIPGDSRMGGLPDLPANVLWPVDHKENPLNFIAQINLNELGELNAGKLLPETGMLYFFYDVTTSPWGFNPEDIGHFKVMYLGVNRDSLRPASAPVQLMDNGIFKACSIVPKQGISLPSWEQGEMNFISEEQEGVFNEHIWTGDLFNKLLGFADVIQNPMELECQLVTEGLNWGDGSALADPKAGKLGQGAKDWILLLQVDSNVEENGMMWGDMGRLYFWIKKQDLAKSNFDRCWCILQCY